MSGIIEHEVVKTIETFLLNNNIKNAKELIFSELNKSENENILHNLYSQLGRAYAMEGKNALALQYLTQAYELAPLNSEVLLTICNFLIANGKHGEAAQLVDIFYEKSRAEFVEKTSNTEEPERDNIDKIKPEDNFDYIDFILGTSESGVDTVSYESEKNIMKNSTVDTTTTNNNNSEFNKTGKREVVVEEVKIAKSEWDGFNYLDLILEEKEYQDNSINNIGSIDNRVEETEVESEEVVTNEVKTEELALEEVFEEALEEKITLDSLLSEYSFVDELEAEPENYNVEEEAEALEPKKINLENKLKKPRLLFTMYGWNESGGGTTFPKAFTKELVSRGFEVAVFYAASRHETINDAYYMENSSASGVNLYGIYNRPTTFFDVSEPLRELKDDRIVELFKKVIEEFKPDIINFHNFLGLSFELANVAKNMNIVSTYTPYNYHMLDPQLYMCNSDLVSWSGVDFFKNSVLTSRYPMLKSEYKQREEAARKLLIETIDYTFAVSNRVKDILTEFVEKDNTSGARSEFSERICVINQVHNTINPLLKNNIIKNKNSSDTIRILFMGAVVPHKGVHLIAQAVQMLNTNKNIQVDIYGFYNEEYGAAIKAIDKSNLITLHGEYTSENLSEIAKNSDIAILPSLWEDCAPFVITEYLAMGLPVIASNIGGTYDFIQEGFNGYYFQTGQARALASVIQSLIDNSFKIEQTQKNCKVNMRFEDYVNHKINIYERLFAGERPKAHDLELKYFNQIY